MRIATLAVTFASFLAVLMLACYFADKHAHSDNPQHGKYCRNYCIAAGFFMAAIAYNLAALPA